MYNLFLDDERFPGDVTWVKSSGYVSVAWVIVRSVEQAINQIEIFGVPDIVLFDHDLGEDQQTGHDFAKWLVENHLDGKIEFPPKFQFFVHSKNPIGSRNIQVLLSNFIEKVLRGNGKS
jgi:hypothetical protein